MAGMTIGRLATESGVSADTIRFWERRGVLPAPARTAAGYRVYGAGAAGLVRLGRRLQRLGLTLDEVAGALRAVADGGATCESQRWRLESALGRTEVRLAELAALRGDLRTALAACDAGTCELAGSRPDPVAAR